MDAQALILCRQIGVIAAARPARVGKHQDALLIVHESLGFGKIGRGWAVLDCKAVDATGAGLAYNTPRPARDLGDYVGAEALDDLVERPGDRGQARQFLDQPVAAGDSVATLDRLAIAIDRPRREIALTVREWLVELHWERMLQVGEDIFARGDVDAHIVPFVCRDVRETAFHQGLAGRDDLDDGGTAIRQILVDCADQGRGLHAGGDEFMIVSDRAGEDAAALAASVVGLFAEPISVGKATLSVSVSVGLANATCESIERSLKYCDLALYKAKAEGKNRWLSYVPEMSEAYDSRIRLEQDLAKAVVQGQIELHYQPIYSPRGRTILMCEALMRWKHPTRGSISPAEFIPLAEQNGLIKSLGSFAIEQALTAAVSWPQPIGVSVNVSAKQFHRDHDLVGIVEDALRRTGIAPHRVIFEVTESSLAEDKDFVIATLHRIRALGVKIALDDFGTGYSSLSYLAELPIDMLKIDRAFMRSIATSSKARSFMQAITGLAGDLKVPMVVEGVETPEQFEAVTRFEPYGVQGFLFARPMPKDAVDLIIDRRVQLPAIDRPSTTVPRQSRSSAA